MTSVTRMILDPKRLAETVQRTFDFTGINPSGNVLSVPVCTATVWSGVDATPSAIVSTSTVSGQTVVQTLTGGVSGVIYLLAMKVTSGGTLTLELDALFAVLPQGM